MKSRTRKLLWVALATTCIMTGWLFFKLTAISPFHFEEKPIYRPLIRWVQPDLSIQEARLADIRIALEDLPDSTQPPTGGTLGYLSQDHQAGSKPTEVRFEWTEGVTVDALSLVPAQHPNSINRKVSLGLPASTEFLLLRNGIARHRVVFELAVGAERDRRATLPFFAEFEPVEVDTVVMRDVGGSRSPRGTAIGEVFVFSGARNLAPTARVSSKTTRTEAIPGAALAYINDEQTGLGLPQQNLRQAKAGYCSRPYRDSHRSVLLEMRWDSPVTVDECRLYPCERLLAASESAAGFPTGFWIEAWSDEPANWQRLKTTLREDFPAPGLNPVSLRFPAISCQRLRLVASDLWQRPPAPATFALSEIEARHDGKPVLPRFRPEASEAMQDALAQEIGGMKQFWSLAGINDGMTTAGRILHERDWLRELARRADLLNEQALLQAAIQPAVQAADRLCWRVSLATPLTLLLGAFAWLARQQHLHRVRIRRVRNQLAADLHDDLGSNLSAIAAYAEQINRRLSTDERSAPAQFAPMQRLIWESLGSLREMVSVTSPQITRRIPFVERLHDLAEIHRAGLPITYHIAPDLQILEVDPAHRRTLRLFLKEALTNILRHSQARHIDLALRRDSTGIVWLRVRDDGTGLDGEQLKAMRIESTLRLRAEEIGSRFSVDLPAEGGTEVAISIKPAR